MTDYWVIIIDSFERDFASICWVVYSHKLFKNKKVCLLPSHDIDLDFFIKEMPDAIIWNYARKNNLPYLKLCYKLGIYNIIHDTEGICNNMERYYFCALDLKDFKWINEIWCWGEEQTQILKRRVGKYSQNLKIRNTGSIRYEYVKSLPKCDFKSQLGEVLWNTNFPSLNPKFQSLEKEFNNQMKVNRDDKDTVIKMFLNNASIREGCRIFIDNLLEKFHHKFNLTVRPHPFESISYYQNIKNKFKEINIRPDGDLHEDINNYSLVIQYGCQTSLDSFLREIPSIKPLRSNKNIWSKVTPFVETENCKEQLFSKKFLQKILNEQRKLFKEYNISSIVNNLEKELLLPEVRLKRKDIKQKASNLIYVPIFYLRFLIKKKALQFFVYFNIRSRKINKYNLSELQSFLKVKYPKSKWSVNKKCLLYP